MNLVGLADTSVFVATETGRPIASADMPAHMAVSVVTVAELRVGVLAAPDAATRSLRLRTLEFALSQEPIPVDDSVGSRWAELRALLRDSGQRMSVNDSWIAATAMAYDMAVVTQARGFDLGLPGLRVINV